MSNETLINQLNSQSVANAALTQQVTTALRLADQTAEVAAMMPQLIEQLSVDASLVDKLKGLLPQVKEAELPNSSGSTVLNP